MPFVDLKGSTNLGAYAGTASGFGNILSGLDKTLGTVGSILATGVQGKAAIDYLRGKNKSPTPPPPAAAPPPAAVPPGQDGSVTPSTGKGEIDGNTPVSGAEKVGQQIIKLLPPGFIQGAGDQATRDYIASVGERAKPWLIGGAVVLGVLFVAPLALKGVKRLGK